MATRTIPRGTSLAARRRTSRPIGVWCVPAHSALRPGERLRVRAVLTRPTRVALRYTWTANAGQLMPRGSSSPVRQHGHARGRRRDRACAGA